MDITFEDPGALGHRVLVGAQRAFAKSGHRSTAVSDDNIVQRVGFRAAGASRIRAAPTAIIAFRARTTFLMTLLNLADGARNLTWDAEASRPSAPTVSGLLQPVLVRARTDRYVIKSL